MPVCNLLNKGRVPLPSQDRSCVRNSSIATLGCPVKTQLAHCCLVLSSRNPDTCDAASVLDQYSTASWGTAQILHINFPLFSELKETEQGQGTATEPSSLTRDISCGIPFERQIATKSYDTCGIRCSSRILWAVFIKLLRQHSKWPHRWFLLLLSTTAGDLNQQKYQKNSSHSKQVLCLFLGREVVSFKEILFPHLHSVSYRCLVSNSDPS